MIIAAPYLLQTSFNLMRHSVKLSFDKSRKNYACWAEKYFILFFFHFIMLHQRKQENTKRFGEEKYLGQTKLL